MFALFIKEIDSFLNSLIAYMVIGVFLTAMGLIMWVFPESSVLSYGYADLSTFFSLVPYVFMFLVPAITMKFFAEEARTGTEEWLMTQPLTPLQIILAKYFAGWALVLLAVVPTGMYFFSVYALGNPVGNLDIPGTIGSYIGLCLLGGVFVSIGVWASALTNNQVVSFVLAVFLCFVLYAGLPALSAIDVWGVASLWLEQVGLAFHYDALSRGLIDSVNVMYFLSVISLMISLTQLKLEAKKW